MPSFADSIFLFILALLLFGPKKLPVLARELGKWMGEFRRASNEFKLQMEDELRASEQAERQKQIAAMEAAAPIPPPLNEPAEPEHPHLRHNTPPAASENSILPPSVVVADPVPPGAEPVEATPAAGTSGDGVSSSPAPLAASGSDIAPTADATHPLPIASSGNLRMMPPASGLPTPRSRGGNGALATLVDALPEAPANGTHTSPTTEPEGLAHGD